MTLDQLTKEQKIILRLVMARRMIGWAEGECDKFLGPLWDDAANYIECIGAADLAFSD